ncbi:MAG: pseudouridine synthase [Bdellovibrionales bacterium]
MPLPILYHDSDLVAVAKPAGLLVHRSMIASDASEFAMQIVRDQIGQHVYPVHRLDRPTSGALVFALSSEMARVMGEEFSSRRVSKKYLAVVRGIPVEEALIDYPLREELDPMTDSEASSFKAPQEAVTRMRRLATCELPFSVDRYPTTRYALVEASPVTGRKHQIRRHLRHLGHPIIGDITHGVGKHNRFFEKNFEIRRLLLACTEISFKHPRSGEPLSVSAPLAPEFKRILRELGWSEYARA